MKYCMKAFVFLTMLVSLSAFTFTGVASAHTVSAPTLVKQASPQNQPPYVIQNVRCCGDSEIALKVIAMDPGISVDIASSFSVTNHYSATLSVAAWQVTAALGYDATYQYTINANCHVTNNTHQVQTLQYYAHYTTRTFEIWQTVNKVGTGMAYEYSYDQCYYSGS